jgi:hypothetical protein
MKTKELANLLDAQTIVPGKNPEAEVTCGYACDLLSWVLAHGEAGMAWTTVQTHVNVVAVAVLMEMACVILAEGNKLEPASLRKAEEEGLTVLATDLTAYEVCGRMAAAGVKPAAK